MTRDAEDSRALVTTLEARGATVETKPLIYIATPSDLGPLDAALRRLDEFDWVVFTSGNVVRALAMRMRNLAISAHALRGRQLAAIGQSTARKLTNFGQLGARVAGREDSDGLLQMLAAEAPGTLLLPQSDVADGSLATRFEQAGFEVTRVVAYRTLADAEAAADAAQRISSGQVDVLVLSSPSNLRALLGELRPEGIRIPLVSFGQATASECARAGLSCVIAERPASDAIAAAVLAAANGA